MNNNYFNNENCSNEHHKPIYRPIFCIINPTGPTGPTPGIGPTGPTHTL